jgi:hypothetical protein
MLGLHRALYEHSHVIDFVHPTEFEPEILDQYKLIVLPFPYYLNQDIAEALSRWVAAGGTLIAEAYPGGWDVEHDRHHSTIPGYGLHEVFGVRQLNALPVPEGGTDDGLVDVAFVTGIPGLPAHLEAQGALVKETFFVENAQVLATYRDGEAAVTMAEFGKGKAVAIGTYLGLPYAHGEARNNGRFLGALVDFSCNLERPNVEGRDPVRIDILRDDDSSLLILQNLAKISVTATFQLPYDGLPSNWTELFSRETLSSVSAMDPSRLTVSMTPNEVKAYRG